MNPLVRWTIGNVSDLGFRILARSVQSFARLYPSVDRCICHNSLNDSQLKLLSTLNTELFCSELAVSCLPIPPSDCMWKLYPPRMRPEAHELVMDNDVLLFDRLPKLEEFWASSGKTIMTEALERHFGWFDYLIPQNVKLNCGFYGFPPGFDFGSRVTTQARMLPNRQWTNHYDDQGLIASILHKSELIVVPLTELSVSRDRYERARYGTHFVGANAKNDKPFREWCGTQITLL